ncbi:MAG: 2-oxoacid:ferredoxin oxidoreductase subunit beta [Gammaproteobacteria bacterium]|nr:2-oxoacid:ferredoxin oxidoreductase subunit beta [Gammaproteobacteria bacterium]
MTQHFHQVEMKPKEFKSEVEPVWCPGCGHYGVLAGMYRAMSELGLDPNYTVNLSGIGCSSRTPYFVQSYKMHTLHGRAGAVATGTQLARPDLAVIVTGGDGDGFSIGGGHMPHLARKNINMTYILMDNRIYGLTKGQVSPTSRKEMKAYTTPYGGVEEPLDPVLYMLTYGATYVGQAFAGNPKMCASLIKGALEHQGFSFVNIFSQCPTFNKIDTAKYFKGLVVDVPDDLELDDSSSAMAHVQQVNRQGKLAVGLLHQSQRTTLDQEMARLVKKVGGNAEYDLQKIVDLSRP